MNRIEEELRDMANRRRGDVSSVSPYTATTARRIFLRRTLYVGTSAAALALLAGGLVVAFPFQSADQPPSAGPRSAEPISCFEIRTAANPCPGIHLSIRLQDDTVQAGKEVQGTLVLTNGNDFPVDVDGDQPEVATFHDPQTGRKVGGYEGWIAGTGWGALIKPGESASLPLIIEADKRGRDEASTSESDRLPAGRYELRATTSSCNPDEGGECQPLPYASRPVTVIGR